uniref:THAP-type domain-containing protein n=1 Tax=Ciona intestinalis TaxID=7719 RepID=F6Q071_CIOIN
KHFEESQFEQFRLDKWRKLKPNAVPTIFDVPNPPKKFKSNRRVLKRPSSVLKVVVERSNLSDAKIRHVNNEDCINVNEGCSKCSQLIVENRRLLGQVLTLKEHLNNQEKKLESFLREDQREALKYPLTSGTHKWSDKTVQQCLNIRCATGANGYEYLRKIGYPAPSYQVLCNKVENIITAPGIQHTLLDWMEIKMSDLSEESHSCSLMLDEVKVTKGVDYDNNIKQFIGFTSPEFKKKLNNEV